MPTAWRIVKERYAGTAFTGEGARLYGGRWNSPGVPMIYTAQSQSLAILEMLVHLESPDILKAYVFFETEINIPLITRVDLSLLSQNWKDDPAPPQLQTIGDSWAASLDSVVLSVPSVLVPEERNFLLNPNHPDFSKLKIAGPTAFQFDPGFAGRRR